MHHYPHLHCTVSRQPAVFLPTRPPARPPACLPACLSFMSACYIISHIMRSSLFLWCFLAWDWSHAWLVIAYLLLCFWINVTRSSIACHAWLPCRPLTASYIRVKRKRQECCLIWPYIYIDNIRTIDGCGWSNNDREDINQKSFFIYSVVWHHDSAAVYKDQRQDVTVHGIIW